MTPISSTKEYKADSQRRWRASHPGYYAEYQKKYGRDNRETLRARATSYLRRLHGFSDESFEEMLSAQEWCCAICGCELKTDGIRGNDRAKADHNHATGSPRGILCGQCNMKLGILEDQDFVAQATEYLESY